MKALSRNEVIKLIQEGKQLSEKTGTEILDHFEKNQPQMYKVIFGEFSDEIAKENIDMADLFLDLCFDIIFVYKMAFGYASVNSKEKGRFEDKIALLDAELKSLNNEEAMNSKFRQRLSDRFVERSIEAGVQFEFLEYLNEQVKNYASFKPSRKKAFHITNNLLFVIVRLMDDVYRNE